MSDKEPRRRKKRKDLQTARKEDLHSDDQLFVSSKMETKDSDQEAEEEVILPSYQPSVFAKFVFVLLFSALVVSMSFIFISLQGTHREEIDIFDDHHAEGSQILHDIHETEHDKEEHAEVEHEEHEPEQDGTGTWSLSKASFQESIETLLPGIGSILSFKEKPSKESEDMADEQDSIQENLEETETTDEEAPELLDIRTDSERTHMQNDIDEDIDDDDSDEEDNMISPLSPTETPPEILIPREKLIPETSSPAPEKEDVRSDIPPMQELDEDDAFEPPTSAMEDSEYITYSPMAHVDDIDEDDAFLSKLEQVQEKSNFIEDVAEDEEEEEPFYEKRDTTSKADYEIRQQLDDLEEALEKGFVENINDDIDDDNYDEDDDDDYEGEEGIVDEFDFWQF